MPFDWDTTAGQCQIFRLEVTDILNTFPQVIVKDLSTHKGTVYAVISGRCLVVSKIHVMKETPPYGQQRMRMISSARVSKARLLY